MFKYKIWWEGCNGAGEPERGLEYAGSDRAKAIEAYRSALDWMGMATIEITVLGREWQKNARIEARREAEAKAEADLLSDIGPDILVYADGTLAFDEGDAYEHDVFEDMMGYGKPIETIGYRHYNRGTGPFAEKYKGVCIKSIRWEVKKYDENRR